LESATIIFVLVICFLILYLLKTTQISRLAKLKTIVVEANVLAFSSANNLSGVNLQFPETRFFLMKSKYFCFSEVNFAFKTNVFQLIHITRNSVSTLTICSKLARQ